MSKQADQFLWNCWYAAAWDYEVVDGKKLARTFLEKPVVIYRGESGRYVALEDRCCHRAAPLSMGRVEGDCIRCMYHGMKYDANGICVDIPGQDRIAPTHRVRSYPIEEKGHLLWIWMGDPEQADPGAIHDFAPLSDPHWKGLPQPAYLHYDANWLLIVDNLADFSHLAFVHTNTLGGSEDYASVSTPRKVEKLPNGFRFTIWNKDAPPPPYHARVSPEGKAKVDRRNKIQMLVPGIFFMETTFAPVGWDPDGGDMTHVRQYRNCQYMTPESRGTAHFFWNYLHDFNQNDPNIAVSLQDSLLAGFMEDKVIIEAQQKRLAIDDPFQPSGLISDVPLEHFRRIWRDMVRAERAHYPLPATPVEHPIL